MGNVQLNADFLLESIASQAVIDKGLQHVMLGADVGLEAFLENDAHMTRIRITMVSFSRRRRHYGDQ